ncbi:MerR family transcriptional regulator [Rhizobium sp. BK529]|uniref:MerR family transcriptional regulator n=1 Tax=Rhizobium sp. BK529 TaxID=2586983 RepID=UPI001611B21C
MRLLTTRAAARLTGLSTNQLREWTSRRALIPADVLHRGRGSPAQYSWQTLLLLRIAAVLKNRFRLELHAHREIFAGMRESFGSTSFLRLWGNCVVIYGTDRWQLIEAAASRLNADDGIVLHLDSHLRVLSAEFPMSTPASAAGQLELFPARLVRREKKATLERGATPTQSSPKRRSA